MSTLPEQAKRLWSDIVPFGCKLSNSQKVPSTFLAYMCGFLCKKLSVTCLEAATQRVLTVRNHVTSMHVPIFGHSLIPVFTEGIIYIEGIGTDDL